jgi:hypothetical protein
VAPDESSQIGRPIKGRPTLRSSESADVRDPILHLRLSWGSGLRRQLEHCCFLTFRQVRQKHNLPVRKFQGVMMGARLIFVYLPERVAEIIRGIGVREKPPMTEIKSLVAGFKSDVALAVGQHRRIVGAGNVGNFCKSIDFHRQRYGAKLEGLRHQGFDGAEIDAAAAQIAQLANDTIDKAQRSGVVEFHRR